MNLLRPTFIQVHLDRLQKNFEYLRSLHSEGAFLCPMVKANAYGHGDVAVAKALEAVDCQALGVASVEEGTALKQANINGDILVFGFYSEEAAKELVAQKLIPVVTQLQQLHWLKNIGAPIRAHIKFNTGMNRQGLGLQETESLISALQEAKNIAVVGYGTHFHTGANLATPGESSFYQVQTLNQILQQLPQAQHIHLHNSAAVASLVKAKKPLKQGSRPGLLVYGIDPEEHLSLKPLVGPVMEFKSKIVATQPVKSGEVVSYGGTWQAQQDAIVGIVPAGYADGVCRSLSNKGEVLVAGQRCSIRGRVCMDYIMIDLTHCRLGTDNGIGEEVVLIGQQGNDSITVEDVAALSGRITYEVMTGLGQRVPRFYGA